MKILVIFFLCLLNSIGALALVPIEGIIYGEVKDIKQYDPFAGMLTSAYYSTNIDRKEYDKLVYYRALYKQGMGLAQKCESLSRAEYANFWKEDTAKRSVVASLQYIGLELTIKSIVNYAKKFELSEEDFKNLYQNLVDNNCSQNISVYSHKMLKSNFRYYFEKGTPFKNPSIATSPYFNQELKKRHDTRKVQEREFEYSIKNFRAFCSWNSDATNLGLLIPYLKNPFIMSYVYNNLLKQTVNVDIKTEEFYVEKSDKGIQISCENMICRRRSPTEFLKYFPRMQGSTALEDDLNMIYCSHFKNARHKEIILSKRMQGWIKEQTKDKKSLETMHFVSLISGFPDLTLLADSYQELLGYFKENIKVRWDRWAEEKSNQFNLEQLYEEPLQISLESQINNNATELGNLLVKFKLELGEMDKLLNDHDKLSTKFNIELPKQYILHLKERIPFYYNSGRLKELAGVEKRFLDNIKIQLEKKKKYFKIPIWNDQMANIISDELLGQISKINVYRFKQKPQEVMKIPVEFNFGIFALQYIRNKYVGRFKKPLAASLN